MPKRFGGNTRKQKVLIVSTPVLRQMLATGDFFPHVVICSKFLVKKCHVSSTMCSSLITACIPACGNAGFAACNFKSMLHVFAVSTRQHLRYVRWYGFVSPKRTNAWTILKNVLIYLQQFTHIYTMLSQFSLYSSSPKKDRIPVEPDEADMKKSQCCVTENLIFHTGVTYTGSLLCTNMLLNAWLK